MIAVFGSLSPEDGPMLRRLKHHAGSALAITLDVDHWTSTPTPAEAGGPTGMLVRHGWRAVPLRPRDRLTSAWQDLGRSSATAARTMEAVPGAWR